MEGDRDTTRHLWHRAGLPAAVIVAVGVLSDAMQVVSEHTIRIVQARRLLPRWDLATHLGHGWMDYHLLTTGQIPQLLWDLWLQGYWPPILSIYQIPFYLALGGGMSSGLRSGLAAFVLTAITGCAVLWRQWRGGAVLAAAIFVALLISSPYLLAYASLAMTETLGACVQLVVLLCYVLYRESPGSRTARWFALSLTALFFTKYNYFFLLVAPLAAYEWFERTSNRTSAGRWSGLWNGARRILQSPAGALVASYLVFLLIVVRTGGFDVHLLGRRVSVHTIGNSGHIVLYLLLARVWYQHRRGRIDWGQLTSADPRVRPLLVWFAVPVTIWLASPYPNHIRDFANLVINRPLGESSVRTGVATYLEALRTYYFYSQWILVCVIVAFAVSAIRYRKQPPVMQWLVWAIPIQCAAIAVHQTRFPRFLLLTVVLLCLAASSEVGRWFTGSRTSVRIGGVLAVAIVAAGLVSAHAAVGQERFREVAFENYTDSEPLRTALDSIRGQLRNDDRLAIVGQSNELSPALFRWELGPPAGLPCFPFEIGGARGLDIALATRVLLLTAISAEATRLDLTNFYLAQRQTVLDRVDRGELSLVREFQLTEMNVALRLYGRTSTPDRIAACP